MMPGLIGSLFLIVVGAIAKYAYSDTVWSWTTSGEIHSLRVDTIGVILMLAGFVALLISIAWGFYSKNSLIKEKEVIVEEVAEEPPVKAKRTVRKPPVKTTETVDEPPVKAKRNTRRKSI